MAAECGVSVNVVYITKHRIAKQIRRELGVVDDLSKGDNSGHDGAGEQLS